MIKSSGKCSSTETAIELNQIGICRLWAGYLDYSSLQVYLTEYIKFHEATPASQNYSQMLSLTGKIALVTGGAVRIGRAITKALQAEGAEVIVHFQSSEDAAKALSPKTIQADLSDPAQCETLIQRASEPFGQIDILINNAAVF